MENVSLRDYFAAKAMQAFLTHPLPEGHTWNRENVATSAFQMADAMLKAKSWVDAGEKQA